MYPFFLVDSFPKFSFYTIAPFVFLGLVLSFVRVYTTWKFKHAVNRFLDNSSTAWKDAPEPPQIPYTVPWLGNTFTFLQNQPSLPWQQLFSWYPRSAGVCTLLVAGRKLHIVFSPWAVQSLFKDRKMNRDRVDVDLHRDVFTMPPAQVERAVSTKEIEHELNVMYLSKNDRVNELTAKFTRTLNEVLSKDAEQFVGTESVGIYHWLRNRMFTASTTALMGERLLKEYPEYCQDFFKFDQVMLSFFFRLPRFLIRDAFALRERLFDNLEQWNRKMREENSGSVVDPNGPDWEPLFGSRLNRGRQIGYEQRGLNLRSSAALDLGITFGLNSNAIPATGWMLMHILDPNGDRTLYPRVLAELQRAQKSDGSIDVPTLISLPLVQSIWTECLRLYVDAMVVRNLVEDTVLPLDADGKKFVAFKKGDDVVAPTWLGHHDTDVWSHDGAPPDRFFAERFLVPNPENPAETIFSMSGSTGRFFPFGGGRTVCPGRTFAKQEALGALAMVLLGFEFEVEGFVDKDGKTSDKFVGFANSFPGSGVLAPGGDLKVKIRRREA